ncbi:MAG: YbaB/EbfC family nucleoid-associated protein, partial [Planctomycetota bacterium]
KEVVGDDVGMLEDMVVAAVEEAQRKADEAAKEEMRRITGSLPIPPGILPL